MNTHKQRNKQHANTENLILTANKMKTNNQQQHTRYTRKTTQHKRAQEHMEIQTS